MAKLTVNTGSSANFGDGTPLRTAFGYINSNFNELYANALISNNVTVGNGSVNATMNSTSFSGVANNSLYLGGVQPNNYINTTGNYILSGNLVFNSNVTVNTNLIISTTANLYVNTITTTTGSSANLIIDPDGTGDVIFTSCTEVFFYSNLQSTNTTTGAIVVNGGIGIANSITVGNTITAAANVISNNLYANTKLQIGSQAGYNFGSLAVIEIDSSANTYIQAVIQNANAGIQASSDLVVTADSGNDSVNYVDLGINSSTYSNATYGISGPLDAYLYSSNSQLIMGTASVKDVVIHAGGTAATNRILTVNTSAVTVNNYPFNVGTGSVNAASYTVSTSFIANATGVYAGVVNGSSLSVGTNVIANTSGITISGYTNTFTLQTNGAATFNGTVYFANTIAANGSSNVGSLGQVLTSGGSGTNVYWSSVSALSTNVAGQFAWTNTQSFSNTITFNGPVVHSNTIAANGTSNVGSAGQVLTSGGAGANVYWSTVTGVNSSSQYTFSNTITFSNNITASQGTIVSNTYTAATSSSQAIDSFATATYRSVKYDITVNANGTTYQTSTVSVVHDGTTPYVTEYGINSTNGSSLATFTASIATGTLTVNVTPVIANTVFKYFKTMVNV